MVLHKASLLSFLSVKKCLIKLTPSTTNLNPYHSEYQDELEFINVLFALNSLHTATEFVLKETKFSFIKLSSESLIGVFKFLGKLVERLYLSISWYLFLKL